MSGAGSSRTVRVVWHEDTDERDWTARAADAIAAALRDALAMSPSARLLVSGGNTPGPVHRALAEHDLDWQRVAVGLVDDRDVDPDHEGSNARLARETLLRGPAAAARFEELRGYEQPLDAAVAMANAGWREHARAAPIAAAVLGMGDDGHTASWFPGSRDLEAALTSREAYVSIDASGCPGAGAYPRRITLTPLGLRQARRRHLLIRGLRKRELFERALEDGDERELPVRAAIDLDGAPLHVHWCP